MRRFYSVQTETNLHENAHNANVCNKNTPGTQRQRNKLQKPQKPNSENLTSRVLLLLLLLAYLQTTASYLDKLVYVLQCDVETATGVYSCLSVDMMFKRQVSAVLLSSL